MNIMKATEKYEAWLAKQMPLIKADLELKHQRMAEAVFPFLRATFYRWAQIWPEVCPELAKAPVVLGVGDLHVENFGTWRDIEGRLVWGVNDFDEAYDVAYTMDLVRLAASGHLAVDSQHLALPPRDACEAILGGYTDALEAGGAPIVLGEHHHWLRELAVSDMRDPAAYWQKLNSLPTWKGCLPASAARGLERMLPEPGLAYRVVHRVAGLGSLGRQRFLAIADWRGGKVAREAKALRSSACVWTAGGKGSQKILYQKILDQAVRCPDPFVRLRSRWIVRRLAPDCSRIEMDSLPKQRDEYRLLYEMGRETANVHLGTRKAVKAVLRDLNKKPPHWLHEAALLMVRITTRDWQEWRKQSAAPKQS